MPTKRVRFGRNVALITYQLDWKPGDQPPADESDYLGWHEWAGVQHKAGLRSKQCGRCCKWKYPQELSGQTIEGTAYADKAMTKPVPVSSPICNKCAPQMEK